MKVFFFQKDAEGDKTQPDVPQDNDDNSSRHPHSQFDDSGDGSGSIHSGD